MQIIQESIIEKAKDFISKHKGKLIAAAGLATLAGAGYYTYNHFNNSADNVSNKTPADTSKTPADTSKTPADTSKTPAGGNEYNKNSGPTLEQRKALIRKIRQEAKERWKIAENIWKKTGKLPPGIDMSRVTIKLNNNTKNIVNTHNSLLTNTHHGFESRDINTDDDF